METKLFSKYTVAAAIVSSLLITACGTGSSVNPVNLASAPGGFLGSAAPASAQALYGTYSAYLTAQDPISGSSSGSQPVTITLAPVTIGGGGTTYVSLTINSTGSTFGNISFSSNLNSLQMSNAYETSWGFISRSDYVQNLSTPPVTPYQQQISFELILALSGNTFDPSSSTIIILDDGLSRGATTSGAAFPFASFSGLAKLSQ